MLNGCSGCLLDMHYTKLIVVHMHNKFGLWLCYFHIVLMSIIPFIFFSLSLSFSLIFSYLTLTCEDFFSINIDVYPLKYELWSRYSQMEVVIWKINLTHSKPLIICTVERYLRLILWISFSCNGYKQCTD